MDWEKKKCPTCGGPVLAAHVSGGYIFKSEDLDEPLGLSILQKMDGEPVWYELRDGRSGWGLVSIEGTGASQIVYIVGTNGILFVAYVYGEPNTRFVERILRSRPG